MFDVDVDVNGVCLLDVDDDDDESEGDGGVSFTDMMSASQILADLETLVLDKEKKVMPQVEQFTANALFSKLITFDDGDADDDDDDDDDDDVTDM